jgi:MFS family permease
MSYLAPVYLAALAFMVLVGLVQAGRMTLNQSLMMEYTDQEYRGRVMSLFTLNMGLMPAGVLPITVMADRFGAPIALGVMAILLILVASTILLASPRLRRLE